MKRNRRRILGQTLVVAALSLHLASCRGRDAAGPAEGSEAHDSPDVDELL